MMRVLRDWGQEKKYEHRYKGFNYRMDAIQGAILRVKLRRLEEWTEARRSRAALYDRLLAGAGVQTPVVRAGSRHVFHVYTIRTKERERYRRLLAERGVLLVCGGLGGVMEAACRGSQSSGGLTVGILPGFDRSDANPFVSVAVATGLGEGRNALVVRAADALVAIGGGYGTLSEIAFALRQGTPVIGIGTWDIEGIRSASGPEAAVDMALA
jgi:uncharacterized protein (TIGR00725 family)